MARRKEAHGGGHGWFVTFADLMGLLVSFFVMLVAFSTQDQAKLQVVAGSMRDAFGVQDRVRYSGIIEMLGLPTRPKTQEFRPHRSVRSFCDAVARRERSPASLWRTLQGGPKIFAGVRLVASGAAGDAGDHRSLQAHHA